MATDVFEENELKLEVKLTRGKWKGTPQAKFVFVKDGTEQAPVEGTVHGETVKCTYKPAKVDDDKSSYTLTWRVEAEDQKIAGSEEIVVWPKGCIIKFFKVDEDKKKVAAPGVSFRMMQKGAVADKCLSWPDGTCEYKFKDPAAGTVEMAAPYEVVEWSKGKEDSGREREVTVLSNFKAAIVSPGQTDDVTVGTETKKGTRQAVNLTTAPGKGGSDGRGHIVEIIVGAEDDTGRDEQDRLGKQGANVFIKCTFSNSSKRTDPKVALMDAQDIKKTSDLKTQTGRVVLGKDGTAKFNINLGVVGGETCEVKIGATKTCEDATTWFENWRIIYYQLTHPVEMAVPDFSMAKAAFEKVKIVLEQYEVKKLNKKDSSTRYPVGVWVRGADIGATADECYVVDYANHFPEKYFQPRSERVHVILCDAQFDSRLGASVSTPLEVDFEFGKSNPNLAENKFSFTGADVGMCHFLPIATHDGNTPKDPFRSCEWIFLELITADNTRGKIEKDAVAIDWAANQATGGKVTVTLPERVMQLLSYGKYVRLRLRLKAVQGPYLVRTRGKHVVITATGRPEIDVNKSLVHELGHAIKFMAPNKIPGLAIKEHSRHFGGYCAKGATQTAYDSGLDLRGNQDCTCVMYGEPSDKTGTEFCELCAPFVLASVINAIGDEEQ